MNSATTTMPLGAAWPVSTCPVRSLRPCSATQTARSQQADLQFLDTVSVGAYSAFKYAMPA